MQTGDRDISLDNLDKNCMTFALKTQINWPNISKFTECTQSKLNEEVTLTICEF